MSNPNSSKKSIFNKSGGFSLESSKKRYTKSSIDRIGKLDLSEFQIHNLDFEEFLENINVNIENSRILKTISFL